MDEGQTNVCRTKGYSFEVLFQCRIVSHQVINLPGGLRWTLSAEDYRVAQSVESFESREVRDGKSRSRASVS